MIHKVISVYFGVDWKNSIFKNLIFSNFSIRATRGKKE